MALNPQDMLDAIDAVLAQNISGVTTIRYSDGRSITYASRASLLNERAYWQGLIDAQSGSGLRMCRLGLMGDA
jgi:uncharacterized protein (DUF934 family)